jgi:hypothetical protein
MPLALPLLTTYSSTFLGREIFIQLFIIGITKSRHRILVSTISVQFTTWQSIFVKFVVILSSYGHIIPKLSLCMRFFNQNLSCSSCFLHVLMLRLFPLETLIRSSGGLLYGIPLLWFIQTVMLIGGNMFPSKSQIHWLILMKVGTSKTILLLPFWRH